MYQQNDNRSAGSTAQVTQHTWTRESSGPADVPSLPALMSGAILNYTLMDEEQLVKLTAVRGNVDSCPLTPGSQVKQLYWWLTVDYCRHNIGNDLYYANGLELA